MAGPVGELVVGAGLLGRGLRLITRRPRLFLLGAIPPLITSVIFTGLLIALITQLDPAVDWLTPFADGWAPRPGYAIRVLVGCRTGERAVLLMVISFTTLTLALGSPLYDKLSESSKASSVTYLNSRKAWHAESSRATRKPSRSSRFRPSGRWCCLPPGSCLSSDRPLFR
jgi:CysZ protein